MLDVIKTGESPIFNLQRLTILLANRNFLGNFWVKLLVCFPLITVVCINAGERG